MLLAIGLLVAAFSVEAQLMNGFDVSAALVPAERIEFGGPQKDDIPAIDKPDFVSAGFATHVRNNDVVLGIDYKGSTRAYPIRILNWHEVVNDRFDDEPVAVIYCPLCGTGMAFVARSSGRVLDFGVSGLLYNSDVLLYDRQTQSLWSQIMATSISGPLKGTSLSTIPVVHTTWAAWRARHPQTRVLSPNTGRFRPYLRDPYAGYESSPEILFSVAFRAQGLHPKERVVGIRVGDVARAFPFVELAKTDGVVHDRIGDRSFTVRFDRKTSTALVTDEAGKPWPAIVAYWFAWYAFHPQTSRYEARTAAAGKPTRP